MKDPALLEIPEEHVLAAFAAMMLGSSPLDPPPEAAATAAMAARLSEPRRARRPGDVEGTRAFRSVYALARESAERRRRNGSHADRRGRRGATKASLVLRLHARASSPSARGARASVRVRDPGRRCCSHPRTVAEPRRGGDPRRHGQRVHGCRRPDRRRPPSPRRSERWSAPPRRSAVGPRGRRAALGGQALDLGRRRGAPPRVAAPTTPRCRASRLSRARRVAAVVSSHPLCHACPSVRPRRSWRACRLCRRAGLPRRLRRRSRCSGRRAVLPSRRFRSRRRYRTRCRAHRPCLLDARAIACGKVTHSGRSRAPRSGIRAGGKRFGAPTPAR